MCAVAPLWVLTLLLYRVIKDSSKAGMALKFRRNLFAKNIKNFIIFKSILYIIILDPKAIIHFTSEKHRDNIFISTVPIDFVSAFSFQTQQRDEKR